MSRLSAARMNAPADNCPSRMRRVIFRKKQPKYNAPIALHGACRSALNEAIKNKDAAAADHIADPRHRTLYGRVSKPALLDLLAGILRGERIVL